MLFKIISLQLVLLYFLPESKGYLELKSACKLYELCDIRNYEGTNLPENLIEKIKEQKERTKQRVLNIKLEKALRAEREKLKWRRKAETYCDSPHNKINKVLGCENLQLTHENYAYFKELTFSCNTLLQRADSGADFHIIIQSIDECERKIHSRVISLKFKSLRSDLQQHCRLERKQKTAIRRANYYDDRARKYRQEANKLGQLVENSLKIEGDRKVAVTLSKDEIEHLLRVIEQKDDINRLEIPEPEIQEESEEVVEEEPVTDLNVLAEIISRQYQAEAVEKLESSEEVQNKPCTRAERKKCTKSLNIELSKPEVDEILEFLETKASEDTAPGTHVHLKDLVGLIKQEVKTKVRYANSDEQVKKACAQKKRSKCASKVALDLSQDEVTSLLSILKARDTGAKAEIGFQVRTPEIAFKAKTPEIGFHAGINGFGIQGKIPEMGIQARIPEIGIQGRISAGTKSESVQQKYLLQRPMLQLHAHGSVNI